MYSEIEKKRKEQEEEQERIRVKRADFAKKLVRYVGGLYSSYSYKLAIISEKSTTERDSDTIKNVESALLEKLEGILLNIHNKILNNDLTCKYNRENDYFTVSRLEKVINKALLDEDTKEIVLEYFKLAIKKYSKGIDGDRKIKEFLNIVFNKINEKEKLISSNSSDNQHQTRPENASRVRE